MNWISIKERLPNYDNYVIWYHESGNMFFEALDKDGNPFLDGKVTHWMELPLPPEE